MFHSVFPRAALSPSRDLIIVTNASLAHGASAHLLVNRRCGPHVRDEEHIARLLRADAARITGRRGGRILSAWHSHDYETLCYGPVMTWSHAASVSFSQGQGAERVASSGCKVEYVASDGA